jgi:tRNA(Ile)-lysidine synthase
VRLRRVEPAIRAAFRAGFGARTRQPPGSPRRVLVAVSGGADSTALLVGLSNLSAELGIEVTAAHLHHGLRGAAADADLAHVRALCERLGVRLIAARWNCRVRMARLGLAGQAGLRTLRRRFLLAAMRKAGAAAIVTGHTADDQLETLLMRLGRGTGLRGLAGIPERRGAWRRPLLGVTRADIEADLRRAGIAWREDDSNGDPRWLRSRVRHTAVPALARALWPETQVPAARALLARHAARLSRAAVEAGEAVAATIRARRCDLMRIEGGIVRLDSPAVASYPVAIQRRVLGMAWRRVRPRGPGLTWRHVEALSRLLAQTRARAVVMLPDGRHAVREGPWLVIAPGRPVAGRLRGGHASRNAARRATGTVGGSPMHHGPRVRTQDFGETP